MLVPTFCADTTAWAITAPWESVMRPTNRPDSTCAPAETASSEIIADKCQKYRKRFRHRFSIVPFLLDSRKRFLKILQKNSTNQAGLSTFPVASLFLQDWTVAVADQLGPHTLSVFYIGERSHLYVKEFVRGLIGDESGILPTF